MLSPVLQAFRGSLNAGTPPSADMLFKIMGVPDPPAAVRLASNQNSRHRLGERLVVGAKSLLGGLHHDYSLVAGVA